MLTTFAVVLAACVIAATVLPWLARDIPYRLQKEWRNQTLEMEELVQAGQIPVDTPPSNSDRLLLVGIAAVGAALVGALRDWTAMSVAYTVFFGAIALLVTINRKHQLLPDTIVLAVLWLGLLCQVLWGDPESAILGAAVGYIVPFAIHLAFKAATGKDGLGCGDMKCMAMSGAWMGFNGVAVALVAFAVATVLMGILAVYLAKHDSQKAIATGPAHLIAALAAFIFISTH